MATPEEQKSKLQAAWRSQREAALSNWGNPNSEFAKSRAADAAEAKARQEKHDAQIRAQVAAKAPWLYAPKRQYADPNQFGPGKMLPGGAPEQLKQLDLSGMKQKKGDGEQPAGDDSAQQAQVQQAQRFAGIQAAASAQIRQQQAQAQQTQQSDEEARQQQTQKKRFLKAALRRGFMFVLSVLVTPALLVNIIVWTFSLGWLNIEMIYGKYFAKGKSRIVDPISWDPIPMPIDKNALILSGFVVMATIGLGLALLGVGIGGYCLIHDTAKITESAINTLIVVLSGTQGQSGGLCLGGIMSLVFGL